MSNRGLAHTENPSAASSQQLGTYALAVGLAALAIMLSDPGTGGGWRLPVFALALAGLALTLTQISLPRSELIARRYVSFGNAFLVYFSVAYAISLFGPDLPAVARVSPNLVKRVSLIGLPVGLLAFFLGYKASSRQVGLGKLGEFVAPQSTQLVEPAALAGIYLITVFARLWLLATGRFGFQSSAVDVIETVDGFGQILNELGSYGNVVIALAVLGTKRYQNSVYWLIPIVGLPIELVMGALSGRKSFFLLAALSAALMLFYTGRLRLRTGVLLGLVAILFIFPVVDEFRDRISGERATRSIPATEMAGILVGSFGSTNEGWIANPAKSFYEARDRSLERLRDVERYALTVYIHETLAFEPIETVPANTVVRLVPRVVWPSKPVIRYGRDISQIYYEVPDGVITATSLSLVGDSYRYGGYAGLVILMAAYGWVLRRWDIAFDHSRILWLLAAFGPLSDIIKFAELARVIPASLRTVLLLAIFMRLALRKQPDQTTVAERAAELAGQS